MNLYEDVLTVQRALNRVPAPEGGPSPSLDEDGQCGPKTVAAIRKYQLAKFGWRGADGLIEPGKQTELALLGASGPASAFGGAGTVLSKQSANSHAARMATMIPRVLHILGITRAQIAAARTYREMGNKGLGFGESAWTKLVRHFKVDQSPDWQFTLSSIDGIYADMQTAIGYVPQGVILFVDQAPESKRGAYAWAASNGYAIEARSVEFEKGWSAGSILLTRNMSRLDDEAFCYIMVHELAHFVGPRSPDITDFAYAHDPKRYAALTPAQRVRNADCYAQFAFEAVGRPFDIDRHSKG